MHTSVLLFDIKIKSYALGIYLCDMLLLCISKLVDSLQRPSF